MMDKKNDTFILKMDKVIRKFASEYNYFLFIYRQYLKPTGYRYLDNFERPCLPFEQLKNEAYKWSLRLYGGSEIPKDKYNILYEYFEYLIKLQSRYGYFFHYPQTGNNKYDVD